MAQTIIVECGCIVTLNDDGTDTREPCPVHTPAWYYTTDGRSIYASSPREAAIGLFGVPTGERMVITRTGLLGVDKVLFTAHRYSATSKNASPLAGPFHFTVKR